MLSCAEEECQPATAMRGVSKYIWTSDSATATIFIQMMRHGTWIVIGVIGAGWMTACAAEESTPSAPAPPSTQCIICRTANNPKTPYAEKASSTLTRGALNVLFGWAELVEQPADEVNNGGNLLTGVGKGVSQAVSRTTRGVGELLTFWLPRQHTNAQPSIADCPVCRNALQQRANASGKSPTNE